MFCAENISKTEIKESRIGPLQAGLGSVQSSFLEKVGKIWLKIKNQLVKSKKSFG